MDIALALSRCSPSHQVFAQAIKDRDLVALTEMLPLVWNDYLSRYFLNLCEDGYVEAVRLFFAEQKRRGIADIIHHNQCSLGLKLACAAGNRDMVDVLTQQTNVDLNVGLQGAFVCSNSNRNEIIDLLFQLGANTCRRAMRDAWGQRNIDLCREIFTIAVKHGHSAESVDAFHVSIVQEFEWTNGEEVYYGNKERKIPMAFDILLAEYYPGYQRAVLPDNYDCSDYTEMEVPLW